MNYSTLNKVLFLFVILLFLFSFSACRTTSGTVGYEWGQGTDSGHPHDIKKTEKKGHHLTHRPTDTGQNINTGIILPIGFTMIRIEIYTFTLKGPTGGSPHHCLVLYRWGLATMSTLRWMSINPIFITMSTNTNILPANSRKTMRR